MVTVKTRCHFLWESFGIVRIEQKSSARDLSLHLQYPNSSQFINGYKQRARRRFLMLTLKQTFGILSLLAASIVGTLRPSSSTITLAGGLLFTLKLALCMVGVSRLISPFPNVDRFWMGFVVACAFCFVISFSNRAVSANTVPEHTPKGLFLFNSATSESAIASPDSISDWEAAHGNACDLSATGIQGVRH